MAEQKEELFIAAATGSRRFDKISQAVDGAASAITDYSIVATIDGQERSESLGEYTKQKFPGSTQVKKPYFSKDAGRFIIRRSDGTEWTQADLNVAVKKIPLNYWIQKTPNFGQPILESNIHNNGDSYLNHPNFNVTLYEGDGNIALKTEKERLQADMMRGNPTFMDESLDGIRSQEVEFILRNPQMSDEREERKREEKELAMDYYSAMKTDPARMIKILHLFNVDISPDSSTTAIRNQLFKKVDDGVTRDRGATYQKLFIDFADLLPADLDIRSTIALASLRRVIYDRAGIYEFDSTGLGSTFDAVVDFLRQPANHAILDLIRRRLEISK